jgi:hypothetical protein
LISKIIISPYPQLQKQSFLAKVELPPSGLEAGDGRTIPRRVFCQAAEPSKKVVKPASVLRTESEWDVDPELPDLAFVVSPFTFASVERLVLLISAGAGGAAFVDKDSAFLINLASGMTELGAVSNSPEDEREGAER